MRLFVLCTFILHSALFLWNFVTLWKIGRVSTWSAIWKTKVYYYYYFQIIDYTKLANVKIKNRNANSFSPAVWTVLSSQLLLWRLSDCRGQGLKICLSFPDPWKFMAALSLPCFFLSNWTLHLMTEVQLSPPLWPGIITNNCLYCPMQQEVSLLVCKAKVNL